jgi:hypothetical protein
MNTVATRKEKGRAVFCFVSGIPTDGRDGRARSPKPKILAPCGYSSSNALISGNLPGCGRAGKSTLKVITKKVFLRAENLTFFDNS